MKKKPRRIRNRKPNLHFPIKTVVLLWDVVNAGRSAGQGLRQMSARVNEVKISVRRINISPDCMTTVSMADPKDFSGWFDESGTVNPKDFPRFFPK